MIRVLITGATGFLGQAAAHRFLEMGWEVTGIGRNPKVGQELIKRGIDFLRADLREHDGIVRACAGQDYVIHCAALSSPWGRYRDFHKTNVIGTANVISGCLRHGVRKLVHVSTPSVYFDYSHRIGLTEHSPLPARPANAYAATKRIAEKLVSDAASQGLNSTILRPKAIFGPGDRTLFPRLLRVNDKRGIPLIHGGQALLDLTYIDDAVDALKLACLAESGNVTSRIYNISGGQPAMLIEVLQQLFRLLELPLQTRRVPLQAALAAGQLMEVAYKALPLLGSEPPFTRFTAGLLAYSQTFDISKARQVLGYEPQTDRQEGLRKFANWWRRMNG